MLTPITVTTMMPPMMTTMTHDGRIMNAEAHWHVCQMIQKVTKLYCTFEPSRAHS